MKVLNFSIFSILFCVINFINAKDWWENGNYYQIYPRSFRDSDGDGVGDLNGITEKLQYLKDIGITGAWLSPIFKSPMADFGYDISDYYKIHPEFGTMEDFENLIKKAKEIGLKIFLDFVPNHTSDEHEWFKLSVNRTGKYENYYVWHDGKENPQRPGGRKDPPSNWLGSFRYSAWEWNDQRQQYYLHQFHKKQPDLNYRDENVVADMKEILKFWLKKGIDGFRIDAVPFLFEVNKDASGNYPDEPETTCGDQYDFCHLNHIYTQDQPETFDMVYQWHNLTVQYKKENGGQTKILLTEAYTNLTNIIKFYGDGTRNGSNVPFNFELLTKLNNDTNAQGLHDLIMSFIKLLPKGVHANWVLGNHDNHRFASRLGTDRADLFNIMLQTLPGIAVTYNGDELGTPDTYIDWEHTVDPQACNSNPTVFDSYSRDPARAPFLWDSSPHAGFTKGSDTWLPVLPQYKEFNVLVQSRAPVSHLQIFKKLIKLRQEPSLEDGTLEMKVLSNNTLIYKRELSKSDVYVIVLNLGKDPETIDLKSHFNNLSDKVEVITTSLQSNYTDGDIISSNSFIAYPRVGAVVVGV